MAIDHTVLYYDYNYHQEGYVFNLYVDSDGTYQGEYADLGTLGRFTIGTFLSYGGEVKYYDEWHQ